MALSPGDASLISEFLRWKGFTSMRPASQQIYRRHVEALAREVPSLVIMTGADLQAWDHRQRGSASSIGQRIAAVKKLCEFLVAKGHRQDDP